MSSPSRRARPSTTKYLIEKKKWPRGESGGPFRSVTTTAKPGLRSMRDFNENVGKAMPRALAYDLEIELIDRDLEFDLDEAIHFRECDGASGDHAAS